jgi:hypothetical protein
MGQYRTSAGEGGGTYLFLCKPPHEMTATQPPSAPVQPAMHSYPPLHLPAVHSLVTEHCQLSRSPPALPPFPTHLLELLVPFEEQDVDRLEVVDHGVLLKLLPHLGAHCRRREVDGVQLHNLGCSPVPVAVERAGAGAGDGPGAGGGAQTGETGGDRGHRGRWLGRRRRGEAFSALFLRRRLAPLEHLCSGLS